MNIFLGAPISEEDSETLNHIILKEHPHWQKHHDIHWTAAAHHHLTLHFFGPIDPQLLTDWVSQINLDLKLISAFSIKIKKINNFPKASSNLVAAYVELSSELSHLYNLVERSVREQNLPVEDRAYLPHITLCRAKRRHILSMTPILVADFKIEVPQLVLYQTQTIQGINRYLPLQQWRLEPQPHGPAL
jgi:2'-5' RNA ligase